MQVKLVYQMEKQLYHDTIISLGNDLHDAPENNYSNKRVIQLESTLLKMVSNTNLCKHRYISNMTTLAMITSGHQNM